MLTVQERYDLWLKQAEQFAKELNISIEFSYDTDYPYTSVCVCVNDTLENFYKKGSLYINL
jgi:hypothetical protein